VIKPEDKNFMVEKRAGTQEEYYTRVCFETDGRTAEALRDGDVDQSG
jgi:hypothetical protein